MPTKCCAVCLDTMTRIDKGLGLGGPSLATKAKAMKLLRYTR
jgi:hypothetical protein